MKIATWNIERFKHKQDLDMLVKACESLNADVLVLTESDERIRLNYRYCFHTPTPKDLFTPQFNNPLQYRETEHRVSIYTNYECVRQYPTFDKYTALCVELSTEFGNLLIYGTIIGILGNRDALFKSDLSMQVEDFKNLTMAGHDLCILGDYNCSFADNYYFTVDGREKILRSFADNHISLVTGKQQNCIDHIALSDRLIAGASTKVIEWNLDKSLSDHKGIMVEF